MTGSPQMEAGKIISRQSKQSKRTMMTISGHTSCGIRGQVRGNFLDRGTLPTRGNDRATRSARRRYAYYGVPRPANRDIADR